MGWGGVLIVMYHVGTGGSWILIEIRSRVFERELYLFSCSVFDRLMGRWRELPCAEGKMVV